MFDPSHSPRPKLERCGSLSAIASIWLEPAEAASLPVVANGLIVRPLLEFHHSLNGVHLHADYKIEAVGNVRS